MADAQLYHPLHANEPERSRTIVICLDGTGDEFNENNTNVVEFFSLLTKGEPSQLVYYQPGIGTYTVPDAPSTSRSNKLKRLDKWLWSDKAFGFTFRDHVMDAYKFLMENSSVDKEKEKDRICIFGFSRGAHAARALAGMIAKVGLLPAGNNQQVPFAYGMYKNTSDSGWAQSVLFKKVHSMDVKIEFVGVWDTVDSVGLTPRIRPFVKNNFCVKTFRHALALDERRVKFKPYCYDKLGSSAEELYRNIGRCEPRTLADRVESAIESNSTDVLEVWFAGCHSDVGGGSVVNSTRFSLARISLRWMIRQCYLTGSGIRFDEGRLHTIGFDSRRIKIDLKPVPQPELWNNPHRPLTASDQAASLVIEAESIGGHYNEWRFRLSDHDAKIKCNKCTEIDYKTEAHILDHQKGKSCPYEDTVYVDEEHEEFHDALSPIFDQLRKPKKFRSYFYRFLEIWPYRQVEDVDDGKKNWHFPNFARPRSLPGNLMKNDRFKVHRSVKTRQEADPRLLRQPHQYEPRLQLGDNLTWEDTHYVD